MTSKAIRCEIIEELRQEYPAKVAFAASGRFKKIGYFHNKYANVSVYIDDYNAWDMCKRS